MCAAHFVCAERLSFYVLKICIEGWIIEDFIRIVRHPDYSVFDFDPIHFVFDGFYVCN